MNKRQSKKKYKKEYQEHLKKNFDDEDIKCINAKCPYFDYIGIYGGGCYATNSMQCPLA